MIYDAFKTAQFLGFFFVSMAVQPLGAIWGSASCPSIFPHEEPGIKQVTFLIGGVLLVIFRHSDAEMLHFVSLSKSANFENVRYC